MKTGRPLKYRNVPTTVDGIWFASKKEAKRYSELRLMVRAGLITEPSLQARFDLNVNGVHICEYRADFVYHKDGHPVVEDAKGVETPIFRMKRLLMLACHGINVVTV